MIVYKTGVIINVIKFKKITLYIDCESSIFLGNIKANEIGIYLPSDEILLNKFNAMNWDVVTDNLIHIKFLIKYSPILSKLIDNDELDFKMVEMPSDDKFLNQNYYIKFNKTDKKFFKINSSDYKKVNNINYNYIDVEKELIDLLNKGDSSHESIHSS